MYLSPVALLHHRRFAAGEQRHLCVVIRRQSVFVAVFQRQVKQLEPVLIDRIADEAAFSFVQLLDKGSGIALIRKSDVEQMVAQHPPLLVAVGEGSNSSRLQLLARILQLAKRLRRVRNARFGEQILVVNIAVAFDPDRHAVHFVRRERSAP